MAKPKIPRPKTLTRRFTFYLDPAEMEQIEGWARAHRVRGLSEAARQLIQLSIQASQANASPKEFAE